MTIRFYAMALKGCVTQGVKVWFAPPTDPVTGEVLDRSPLWRVEINGLQDVIEAIVIEFGPDGTPTFKAREIDEVEYKRLCAVAARARTYFPDSAEANPKKAINHLETETLF